MAECTSCGAQVHWARTARNRKRVPLDAEPVNDWDLPGLLIRVEGWAYSRDHLVQAMAARDGVDEVRALATALERYTAHRSHFATCPNAKQHRR